MKVFVPKMTWRNENIIYIKFYPSQRATILTHAWFKFFYNDLFILSLSLSLSRNDFHLTSLGSFCYN